MALYTLKNIAEALGISYPAADKRAKNGRKNRKGVPTEAPWVVHSTQVVGKSKTAFYDFAQLPKDVREALTRDVQEAIRLVDTLSSALKRIEKAIARFDAGRRSA